MARTPFRTTERGLERFIFFTDAVTAVAITLLVLPLVEEAAELTQGADVWEHVVEDWVRLFGFVLSFAIIGLFWTRHHRFSEQLVDYDGVLLWTNLGWMFTIVALPLSTELLDVDNGRGTGAAIYIGNMLATVIMTILMQWRCVARPALVADAAAARGSLIASVSAGVLFVIALVIVLIAPQVGAWALLVLFLSEPARRLLVRAVGTDSGRSEPEVARRGSDSGGA